MTRNYSVQEVKESLPRVLVKYPNGQTAYAKITGRLLRFPRLTVANDAEMSYFETSWEAVTRAVNNNTPITI